MDVFPILQDPTKKLQWRATSRRRRGALEAGWKGRTLSAMWTTPMRQLRGCSLHISRSVATYKGRLPHGGLQLPADCLTGRGVGPAPFGPPWCAVWCLPCTKCLEMFGLRPRPEQSLPGLGEQLGNERASEHVWPARRGSPPIRGGLDEDGGVRGPTLDFDLSLLFCS